jgi:hypothetical protein
MVDPARPSTVMDSPSPNYRTPSPFGEPQQPFAPAVPASATVLLICGVFKIQNALLLFGVGALAFTGTAVLFHHNDFLSNILFWLGGTLGAVLLCLGAALLVGGIFDAVGGHYARQGKKSGRIMGIISSVLGLLGTMGSLTRVPSWPGSYFSQGAHSSLLDEAPSGFAVGSFTVGAFLFALNLYLLVSFLRNGHAFKR